MILDWAEACDEIFNTHRLLRSDPSDNKSYYKQEIIYLRYLRDVKGYTADECYMNWLALENGTASAQIADASTLRFLFHRAFGQSYVLYRTLDCQHRLAPVTIYQSEIDFLNQLDMPLWVKQYWMALLVYFKFGSQISATVAKTPTLNAWCIRQTAYKDKRYGSKCQDKITKYQQSLSNVVIKVAPPISDEKYVSYEPTFLTKDGQPVIVLASLRSIQAAISLVKPSYCTCEKCGRQFEKSAKQKRTMCDTCYHEWRITYNKQFRTPKPPENVSL